MFVSFYSKNVRQKWLYILCALTDYKILINNLLEISFIWYIYINQPIKIQNKVSKVVDSTNKKTLLEKNFGD